MRTRGGSATVTGSAAPVAAGPGSQTLTPADTPTDVERELHEEHPMARTEQAPTHAPGARTRPDRCPGVLEPWLAEDGALLRIRLVGGLLTRTQLAGLAALSRTWGDGSLHLTTRANVQVRAVPVPVPDEVVAGIEDLGLLPSRTHERARNVLVSPLTGRAGGQADLRPLAAALDEALRADPALAGLPGRFLLALDDRGDLLDLGPDLAAVALDRRTARLWAGGRAGEVVPLAEVPGALVALARRFLDRRGTGPTAPWHVAELPGGAADLGPFAAAPVPTPVTRPAHGPLRQDDGRRALHLDVPEGLLTPPLVEQLLGTGAAEVVVTPWRSVVVPDLEDQ